MTFKICFVHLSTFCDRYQNCKFHKVKYTPKFVQIAITFCIRYKALSYLGLHTVVDKIEFLICTCERFHCDFLLVNNCMTYSVV